MAKTAVRQAEPEAAPDAVAWPGTHQEIQNALLDVVEARNRVAGFDADIRRRRDELALLENQRAESAGRVADKIRALKAIAAGADVLAALSAV
jgi:hypothetical protein